MPGFQKLQSMLDAAMKQAGEESSMLLGQNLEVADSDMLNTDRQSFLAGEDGAIYVVGVESREAYPGRFYLLFALADAIVMSSILLGIPAPRIQEKRRLSIQEPDDVDAFGEIANQIIGSFNSVFQPKLPEKVHLKLLPPQKYVPDLDTLTEELPFPEGSYVMYRAPLEIAGHEMNRLDIMIPHPLANLFDPQPEQDGVPAVEEPQAAEEQAEEPAVPLCIVVLGDEADRQELVQGLTPAGYHLIDAPLGTDLPRLFSGETDVNLALITLKRTSDRDLAICKRVVPMLKRIGGSVVVCAPEWTRSSVLKALKAGVRGVLMPPFGPDELHDRLGKILNSC